MFIVKNMPLAIRRSRLRSSFRRSLWPLRLFLRVRSSLFCPVRENACRLSPPALCHAMNSAGLRTRQGQWTTRWRGELPRALVVLSFTNASYAHHAFFPSFRTLSSLSADAYYAPVVMRFPSSIRR